LGRAAFYYDKKKALMMLMDQITFLKNVDSLSPATLDQYGPHAVEINHLPTNIVKGTTVN